MANAPSSFLFAEVPSTDAAAAFAFHHSIAKSNEYIYPRSEQELLQFAEERELFGVRRVDTAEFVGLCYAHLDEQSSEWEIGGLTINADVQRIGLGAVLARFALAHTIATDRPWNYHQEIVANVHIENDKPRKLLERLGFEHVGTTKLVLCRINN